MSMTEDLNADDPRDRDPEFTRDTPDRIRAIFEQAETVCREADAETERLRTENERLKTLVDYFVTRPCCEATP